MDETMMAQARGPQGLYDWLEAVMARGRWCALPAPLEDVIRITFRRLANMLHTDKNYDTELATPMFKKVGQW